MRGVIRLGRNQGVLCALDAHKTPCHGCTGSLEHRKTTCKQHARLSGPLDSRGMVAFAFDRGECFSRCSLSSRSGGGALLTRERRYQPGLRSNGEVDVAGVAAQADRAVVHAQQGAVGSEGCTVCQGGHLRRRAVSRVASHAGTADGRARTSGNGTVHRETDVTGAVAVVIGEVATGGVVTPARQNAGCSR